MSVLLSEYGFHDLAAGAAGMLPLSKGEGYNHPTAPDYYPGCQMGEAVLTRQLPDDLAAGGASMMSWGVLSYLNLEGGLTPLVRRAAFDGWPAKLLIGRDEDSGYDAFVPLAAGTIEQAWLEDGQFKVRWRDDQAAIVDTPISGQFAGDGSAADGGAHLESRRKPGGYGRGRNMTATLLDDAIDLYWVADKAVNLDTVFDGGVSYTMGVRRDTLDNLRSTAPEPGHVDWYRGPEGTRFRLGTRPRQAVTYNATEGDTAAARTPAQIFLRILVERATIAPTPVTLADVAALDALTNALHDGTARAGEPVEVESWWGEEERTIRDVLAEIAASVGATFWLDQSGSWRICRIDLPQLGDATAIAFRRFDDEIVGALVTDGDVLEAKELEDQSERRGVPPSAVTLSYDWNYTPQAEDALGGDKASSDDPVGGAARREWLRRDSRKVTASNDNTNVHKLAKPLKQSTRLVTAEAAGAEAARRLAQLQVQVRLLHISAAFGPAQVAGADIGCTVELEIPDIGAFGAFLVRKVEHDLAGETAQLELVGRAA